MKLKAHLKHRTFIFVHHFSGAKDVLGEAVMAEAKEQGVRVTVVSVDTHLEGGVGRAVLDGDLSKDRPPQAGQGRLRGPVSRRFPVHNLLTPQV